MKYILINFIYLISKPDFTRIVSQKTNLLYMFDTEGSGLNGVFVLICTSIYKELSPAFKSRS